MTMPSRPDAATAAFRDPMTCGEKPVPDNFPFLEPASEPGDLGQLGKYRVVRLLGHGGMGYVFAAEDTHLRRPVALKVMRPELAADYHFRERFLQEARAAAQIESEFIVTVYEVGLIGDVPFISLHLLTGESLQDKLERDGPMAVNMAAHVTRQAAEGLAAAHAQGMTHRDIKPANLWLEADKTDGSFKRVKILDFGLAKPDARDTKLTGTGVIVGTPHYMAPEQASGLNVDGRADLFSLGCVAYTMLTGKLAFDGSSTMAVLMALANHIPPPLSETNLGVPRPLSDLIARLMAKNRDDRPAVADDVIAELDAIQGELPAVPITGRGTGTIGRAMLHRKKVGGSAIIPAPGTPPASSRSTPIPWGAPSAPQNAGPAAPPPLLPSLPAQASPAPPPMEPTQPRPELHGRSWKLVALGSVLLCVLLAALLGVVSHFGQDGPPAALAPGEPLPVGILHSTTGTMATSESPVVDATLLAIQEVNQAGGVLGRPLKPIEADGQSDSTVFAREAERLLNEQHVAVIFGCWTSASRKAVRPRVEQHNGLLFYPVQYEGLEQSPRIVYLGPAPNQQLLPAVDYLVDKLGKRRFFLVGSDYVFPRAAHEIVKDALKFRKGGGNGAAVVGEEFLPLGTKDVAPVLAAIKAAKPDVILNAINGSTNFHFFKAMNADPALDDVPVVSFSLMETDLRALDPKGIAGDFLVGTYFQSVQSDAGRAFLDRIRSRYGRERTYSDPMAAAYTGVHLWARAANAAGTTDPAAVVKALSGVKFDGPIGPVRIDPETQHAWLPYRIGRVTPDGQVQEVYGSGDAIKPEPFPPTRTRAEWERFLEGLYVGWDNQWQAPAAKP